VLLALSVKQVHAGKLTINRLATLRVQPLKYVADKDLYVKELDEACTLYHKAFLKHWIEADATIVDNLILHFVYDPQSYCNICEKVLCNYRANRDFDGTECELYDILSGVAGLTSDLRADCERFVNALFPLPLLQNEKGKTHSLYQLQKDITVDERLITQLNIKDQACSSPLQIPMI
jgi:hypothetical protein